MTWSLFDRDVASTWNGLADLVNDLWSLGPSGRLATRAGTLLTPVETWISGDDAIVAVELPGVDPADVHVAVEGDTLKVWGERKTPEPAEGEHYHRRERPHGTFERSVEVPFRIDPKSVEAGYENGMLKVRLPRAPEYRPRKIEVKAG